MNAGLRSVFQFGDDVNNLLNPPLLSPDVGNVSIYIFGNFFMQINPTTPPAGV